MILYFANLPQHLEEGTKRILERNGHIAGNDGLSVSVRLGNTLQVTLADNAAQITYPTGAYFRALGLLLAHINEKEYTITEEPKFAHLGLQVDVSRNGAMRIDSLKELMDMLALMGYQQLYLYMEDMYCLPDRFYFGYMRGKYTPEELKELDDYAAGYEMELIPSIQTLGHMEQYLRWDEASDVRDTNRELLTDNEATYQLIRDMIQAVMAPLRTKKIVLGLDETHNLGLGNYLSLNGYAKKEQIFCRHLNKVFEIVEELELEGMLYSDMFFRMAEPDASYYSEATVIPPEVAEKIPEKASVIYWHYGEKPGCDEYMLKKHMALHRKTVFFGGTWTWSGHLPHTEYALRAAREALPACAKYGIGDVVQSIWGDDDGMSCSHFYCLLTLQYTAEYAFGHEADNWLAERFRFCTDGDMDAFLAMSDYQCKYKFQSNSDNFMDFFRGKTLFWQDVLLGQADEYLRNNPMSEFYGQAAGKFESFAAQPSRWQKHYAYIETVFRCLSLKCEIAEKLEPAYKNGDTGVLAEACKVQLPRLLTLVESCHRQQRDLWMQDCKPFGWEVQDHNYGGMEARICTACQRLEAYLDGAIPRLEELEDIRLPMTVSPWNTIRRIVTTTADF